MGICTVVTEGFGNGTFKGTIALVVTRGYTSGNAVVSAPLPRQASSSGGGTSAALLVDPRAPRAVELQIEPLWFSFWAIVPLEAQEAPGLVRFFGSVELSVVEPLSFEPLMVQLGLRVGGLEAGHIFTRIERELAHLRRRQRDEEDLRLLGEI